MLYARSARLLLVLYFAVAQVSPAIARSDPSLFWGPVTTAPPPAVSSSETPTMAPVVPSSAPAADLVPTPAPVLPSSAPVLDLILAPTSVPPPAIAAPVPAPSADGGPITTEVDPEKDFGPIAGGGGGRPTLPLPVPAPTPETPAPVAETPAPSVETPAPVAAETLAPTTVTDPATAPDAIASSEAPVSAALNTPVETPVVSASDETMADNGAPLPSPDSDAVGAPTGTVAVMVDPEAADDEAPVEEALSPDTDELLPSDDSGFVGIDEQPQAVPDQPVVDGQADEAVELPVIESSNSAPLTPSPEPAGPEATQAPQTTPTRAPVVPPPQVVTGTAANGSLTSTVIFSDANILTPHS